MKTILFSAYLALSQFACYTQTLTSEEQKLYDLLMAHRKASGLAEIPLSPSLTFVAQTHVKDLVENKSDTGQCNLHSWSGRGSWSACCYTDDHAAMGCMWNKPGELTSYPGNGYEISSWSGGNSITAETAIGLWKKSGHNEVMINQGVWKHMTWNAVGVGIYKGYAVIWFGREIDGQ